MVLGSKIVRRINTLGSKTRNKIDVIGRKTQNTFDKVNKVVGNIDRKVENTIDRGSDIAQKVIKKSGQITDGLRIGANIGSAVADQLAMTGLPGSQALASGAKMLSKGANKLDKVRDRAAQKIEDTRDRAILEKDNLRKKIDRKNQKMKEGASELFY
jgi:hypothetical protein